MPSLGPCLDSGLSRSRPDDRSLRLDTGSSHRCGRRHENHGSGAGFVRSSNFQRPPHRQATDLHASAPARRQAESPNAPTAFISRRHGASPGPMRQGEHSSIGCSCDENQTPPARRSRRSRREIALVSWHRLPGLDEMNRDTGLPAPFGQAKSEPMTASLVEVCRYEHHIYSAQLRAGSAARQSAAALINFSKTPIIRRAGDAIGE
jgi:hypothetical protein